MKVIMTGVLVLRELGNKDDTFCDHLHFYLGNISGANILLSWLKHVQLFEIHECLDFYL